MILGLVGNPNKKSIYTVVPQYIDWLEKRNIEYLVSCQFSDLESVNKTKLRSQEEIGNMVDILLSFGGDGTFLNTISKLHGLETPVLGVNLGGLGYLAEVNVGELFDRTEDLLAGKWQVEKRMILEARVENKESLGPWYALNDVVIDKGGYTRMIEITTTIDGKYLNTYHADGLLIATPTGSTGYSLSAGGPIIEPKMRGILVHPLNPHSLSNRPLLITSDKSIRVHANTQYDHVAISVDGQIACTVESKHTVIVKKADFSACMVTFEGRYFYEVLRQKLGWGDKR